MERINIVVTAIDLASRKIREITGTTKELSTAERRALAESKRSGADYNRLLQGRIDSLDKTKIALANLNDAEARFGRDSKQRLNELKRLWTDVKKAQEASSLLRTEGGGFRKGISVQESNQLLELERAGKAAKARTREITTETDRYARSLEKAAGEVRKLSQQRLNRNVDDEIGRLTKDMGLLSTNIEKTRSRLISLPRALQNGSTGDVLRNDIREWERQLVKIEDTRRALQQLRGVGAVNRNVRSGELDIFSRTGPEAEQSVRRIAIAESDFTREVERNTTAFARSRANGEGWYRQFKAHLTDLKTRAANFGRELEFLAPENDVTRRTVRRGGGITSGGVVLPSGTRGVFSDLKRGADDTENSVNRLRQALADLSPVDETVNLGLKRLFSLFLALASLLPVLETALGLLSAAAVSAVGGITALVGALSTLVGVVATLPAALAGVAGIAGAVTTIFGPAISTVVSRIQEVIQARDSLRKSTGHKAGTGTDPAEQLAELRQRDAEQVQDIERQIRRTRRDSAEQVMDQERQRFRLVRDNREQERDLDRQIAQERRDAADRLLTAEQRLHEIRARNTLRERQLSQDVSARRAELMALRAAGASDTSVAAAAGRLNQAQEAQREFQVSAAANEEKRAAKDVADTRRQNEQRISDLLRQRRRLLRDNNEQEQDQERQLFRLQRNNREQLQDLERSLFRARRDNARNEQQAARAAGAEAQKSADIMRTALQGLDPAQRRAVRLFLEMKKTWHEITAPARQRFEALGLDVMTFIQQHLPAIAQTVSDFANDLTDMGNRLLNIIKVPANMQSINNLFKTGRILVNDFGNALLDLVKPILQVSDAARPLAEHLGQAVRNLSGRAAASVNADSVDRGDFGVRGAPQRPGATRDDANNQRTRTMRFFEATRRVSDLLGKSLGNLALAFKNILEIAEPFGEKLLRDFTAWTQRVLDFTNSVKGKNAIRDFFRDATPAFEDFVKTAAGVVKALFEIGRELIRPGSGPGGKGTALGNLFQVIRDGLPQFTADVINITEHFGPRLIKFVQNLIHFFALAAQPNGPLGLFLGLVNGLGDAFKTLGNSPGLKQLHDLLGVLTGLVGLTPSTFLLDLFAGTIFAAASLRKLKSFRKDLQEVGTALFAKKQTKTVIDELTGESKTVTVQAEGSVRRIVRAFIALPGRIGGQLAKLKPAFQSSVGVVRSWATNSAGALSGGLTKMRTALTRANLASLFTGMIGALKSLGAAIVTFSRTTAVAFLTNPWVLAILAVIAVIVILDRKFHFIMPTIRLITRLIKEIPGILLRAFAGMKAAITDAFNWVRNHWKLILGVLTAPFGGFIIYLVTTFHGKIVGFLKRLATDVLRLGKDVANGFVNGFKTIGQWFLGVGRWLRDHIINPIKRFFRIGSPSKLMHEIGHDVVMGFVNAFAVLPGLILGIVKKIPGMIKNALKGLPGVIGGIIDKIPGVKGLKGAVSDALHGHKASPTELLDKLVQKDKGKADAILVQKLRRNGVKDDAIFQMLIDQGLIDKSDIFRLLKASGGPVRGIGVGDTVPAMLTPGEWVLNQRQQARLSTLSGFSVGQLQQHLFMRRSLTPHLGYALGGVVSPFDTTAAATNHVTQHVTVNTTSPRVDVDYVSRVLRNRMMTRL